MLNLFKPRCKKSYWISFKELLAYSNSNYSRPTELEATKDSLIRTLVDVLKECCNADYLLYLDKLFLSFQDRLFKWSPPRRDWSDSTKYVTEIWNSLKKRYLNEYCFAVSFYQEIFNVNIYLTWTQEQKYEFQKEASNFFVKLLAIMDNTIARYSTLLEYYENQKANLLNKVEAITRFNDTPQDSGDFADDQHTTHITSSKNDFDTLMGRIDEIDRKYRNLLKDWSDEFSALFIHGEGL